LRMTFNTYFVLVAASVCLSAIGYGIWKEVLRRSRRRERIAERESLSEADIYDRFYRKTGLSRAAVLKYWNEVARWLRMPAGKLRPSDRFDVELAPVKGAELDDEIEELSDYLEEEKTQLGINADLAQLKTLDDLIRLFAAQRPQ